MDSFQVLSRRIGCSSCGFYVGLNEASKGSLLFACFVCGFVAVCMGLIDSNKSYPFGPWLGLLRVVVHDRSVG